MELAAVLQMVLALRKKEALRCESEVIPLEIRFHPMFANQEFDIMLRHERVSIFILSR